MGSPRKPHSWLEDFPRRYLLERSAKHAFPDMKIRRQWRPKGLVDIYEVGFDIPGYEHRKVAVEFTHKSGHVPSVFSDGPSGTHASPHRYAERNRTRLCIWYPGDPAELTWIPAHGLLMLLGMIQEHLFKEAYWRETQVWLGDEAPHDVNNVGT